MPSALPLAPDERVNWRASVPFLLIHLLPVLAVFTGVDARAVTIGVVTYAARMFFITGGYHRYFSHRSYRASRPVQFLLGFGGTMAAQKGPLWWAAHHRDHHRFSDTEQDVHSPLKGFWYSHVGWILADKYKGTDLDAVPDLARYPELRFIDRHDWIGPWTLGVACYLVGGWSGLVIGFFASTILLWHATFTVNSLAHVFGRRRYATTDTSRNSLLIALITGGEGWHNNHHHYQASARQGFFWWEIDTTYYVLRAMSLVGLVRDLRQPSAGALAAPRVADGAFDIGTFRNHWLKARAALARNHHAEAALALAVDDEVVGAPGESSIESRLRAGRAALEHGVEECLRSAESLGRLTRQRTPRPVPLAE